MSESIAPPRKIIDWQPVREAFVQRAPKPTWEEMEAEFAVAIPTMKRCAHEEGWTSLRASHMDAQLAKADASAIILQSIKVDRSLVASLCDLALVAFGRIKDAVGSIDDSRAPQTKLDALNTAGFATANFCRALKDAGVIGMPKGLAEAGDAGNGRWNPGMLNQINIQLTGLAAATDKAAKDLEQTVTAKVEPTETPGEKP